jgi:hypothetical protein
MLVGIMAASSHGAIQTERSASSTEDFVVLRVATIWESKIKNETLLQVRTISKILYYVLEYCTPVLLLCRVEYTRTSTT